MKKKTALILASIMIFMTGCGNADTSHTPAATGSSTVEEVLAERMAEADAQAADSSDDLSEVPGLSDSQNDYERGSGVTEGAPEPDMAALDESVLQFMHFYPILTAIWAKPSR